MSIQDDVILLGFDFDGIFDSYKLLYVWGFMRPFVVLFIVLVLILASNTSSNKGERLYVAEIATKFVMLFLLLFS